MKIIFKLILLASIFLVTKINAQNVGIGTTNPTHFFHIKPPAGAVGPVKIEGLQLYGNSEKDILIMNQSTGIIKYMPYNDLLQNLDLDSIILNSIISNADTIYANQEVIDSILSIVHRSDSLSTIVGDNLITNNNWMNTMKDSVNTDQQRIDAFMLNGTSLNLSIENDSQNNQIVDLSAFYGDITEVTADNGLTISSGGAGPIPNIQLGGTLNKATNVSQGANDFSFDLDGAGNFEIRDNGSTFIYAANNGRLGIGTSTPSQALEISGRIKTNGINESSDRRFKKQILNIEDALNNIMKLRGVNYKWRKDEFPNRKFEDGTQLGVIAQEIEAVYPEVVHTDDQGYKSVDYSHIVPVLIEAVKELNIAHSKEIELLKKENSTLKANVNQNEKAIEFIMDNLKIESAQNK